MPEKILMVDDESSVLVGYQRIFHHEFQIDTAPAGRRPWLALKATGPYAVVVSDMRMPEMDGASLLAKVKLLAPETVRIMLTGNSDIQSAVSAVNEGNIFRFLTKPCNKEALAKALTAGLVQYRLLTVEKDLLENTLQGCIQVLTEMLALVNPAAFGRAQRIRRYMHQVAERMDLESPWRFEVAAMMSQLGCVTLHPETIEAVHAGRPLPPDEQARFDAHPGVAHDLLAKIPRLEPMAWMIAHQNRLRAGRRRPGDSGNRRTCSWEPTCCGQPWPLTIWSERASRRGSRKTPGAGRTRISIPESLWPWWSWMARRTKTEVRPCDISDAWSPSTWFWRKSCAPRLACCWWPKDRKLRQH